MAIRIVSAPTTISVFQPGVDAWRGGNGAAYKGNQTFSALAAVVAAIPGTGGWAQLGGTVLKSAYLTRAQMDSIAPPNVLRQNSWPDHMCSVWGSAAWNGFGWFIGAVGQHFAYGGNDFYLVRLSDPVAVIRLHDPAPISYARRRSSGLILNSTGYAGIAVSDLSPYPDWGPQATHVYDGTFWDAANELLVFSGDEQTFPDELPVGRAPSGSTSYIYFMNPYAATPRQAWTRVALGAVDAPAWPGTHGALNFVDNADGTYSFTTRAQKKTLNVATRAVINGSPGPGPLQDNFLYYRTSFRDPTSNKYYDINLADRGAVYGSTTTCSIFEITSGGPAKVCDLPSPGYRGRKDSDNHGGVVVLDGHAYIWCGEANVFRVNLSTGAVQTYTDSTSIAQPIVYNGIYGRWAYVPQARCFVGLSSESTSVYVFRPPASWGIG